MMIQTALPVWFWLVAVAVAAGYAGAMYYRNRKDGLSKGWKAGLAAVRFLSVFLICILLMSPVARMQQEQVQKPLCFVAVDDSRSMRAALDPEYRNRQETDTAAFAAAGFAHDAEQQINQLCEELSGRFQVQRLAFGREVRQESHLGRQSSAYPAYAQEATDYARLFQDMAQRFSASSAPDAVAILISDGQANLGQEPAAAYRTCPFPLYCIGIGDTLSYPDIFIDECRFNPYTFLGNRFPLQIRIGQQQAADAKSVLRLSEDGKVLLEQEIDLSKHDGRTINWTLEAAQSGIHRYVLSLDPVAQEKNLQNNRQEILIQVLDNQQKILIAGNAPHPDLSCLHQSLSRQEKYLSEVILAKDIAKKSPEELQDYDLFILHGLPSRQHPLKEHQDLLSRKPCWFIIGSETIPEKLNQAGTGLGIQVKNNGWEEAQAALNPDFGLFEISPDETEAIQEWPPLWTPFARYDPQAAGRTVLYQSILGVKTENPLLWVSPPSASRSMVLCGYGLWRWRLADYQEENSTEVFDRLIDRCVSLLSELKPEENLIVHCPNLIDNTQSLQIRAELYNQNFEKVSTASVGIEFQDRGNGQKYEYSFLPQPPDYFLDAGILPAGDYDYTAHAKNGAEEYTAQGRFAVAEIQLENLQLPAHLELLRNLALAYDGRFYYAGSAYAPQDAVWKQILHDIENRPDLKPVVSYRHAYVSFLEQIWLLIILLGLFSLEYSARKIFGNL